MVGAVEIVARQVPVDGGDLAVFGLGQGPPVIAVHGITASSHAWIAVARELDGRARLEAVDMRGRGSSGGLPGPYGPGIHVADLVRVLDALELERPVLVGHSMGAYVLSRFGVEHPDRVGSLVLVDGGLAIPAAQGIEPQAFAEAFLGPALARLKMTFASNEEYREWWSQHPAIAPGLANGTVESEDLAAYADHDLIGEPPQMRSPVNPEAVRADVVGLVETRFAHELAVAAQLLSAPRGLGDEPSPMQPAGDAQAWANEDPERRQASLVDDVNHYTITLSRPGAMSVAAAIAAAVTRSR